MPTSLIHNWVNEIQKFAPHLKVLQHTGNNRSKDPGSFDPFDLVLTTYGIIRNDTEIMKDFYFHYIILDESQVIKNPFSKTYKCILQLQSEHKIVLTGTPIENSLVDLWAQLNFLNRGLLGNLAFFKEKFVIPIEKQNDEEQQGRLQTLIHPFILRRTKNDVEKDLPPVTQQILYCDMTEEQEKIYEEEKSRIRNHILETIEEKGVENSSMVILEGLNKLRQIANHPRMINAGFSDESGKFNDIIFNLHNLLAENHKVLIFSSFVKHLELIREHLDEENIGYALLTGQTRDRQEKIRLFQERDDYPVFLISLKAGGFGLNLTAADYVFLIDPWWNPASEEQAISRAHRIGQKKNVFVYRFITYHTIEEKIQKLQQKKSDLAHLFINSNNPFRNIGKDRINELFT